MARSPQIIDQWGNPVSTRQLKQEVAAPTLGGVHSVWTPTIVSGLTPIGLAEILRAAARGYPDQFFALATEMEERDLHYAAVLGTRKRAITGIKPIVVSASDAPEDEKIADAVRELVEQPEFADDYLADLLDALGKGYSVVETIWDRSGKEWMPARYEWRDQRHFQIDQRDGRTLRLKTTGDMNGIDLPPYQFTVHRPKLMSGLPIRAGLARLAAWAFLFKSYTLKDWMAFIEVYGMPLRVGKFGRGASLDDRRVLLQAVRDISSDAAAIIPKEMEIEFIEVAGASGNAVFSEKSEYLDRQISKGVLGQTMTTDDGSSLSQAAVHENVRHDIARADARQTAIAANRDLIRPFVDLNFGRPAKYPTLVIPITENEDIKALVDAVERLVPLGLKVGMADVRERVGFEEPDDGVELLSTPTSRPPVVETGKPAAKKPEPANDQPTEQAAARLRTKCPDCGGYHATAADERPELDVLVDDALSDWEGGLEPLMKPLRTLVETATSYAQLEAGLDDLIAKMDAGPLADRLAKLMMKARGLGDIGDGRA
ncbi:UNVERIFIED_ORG: phage gp29-like protein [Shinella zoogloeoides]|nr:phage gp29-like protein [Shinella zoogloeoides]